MSASCTAALFLIHYPRTVCLEGQDLHVVMPIYDCFAHLNVQISHVQVSMCIKNQHY